MEETNLSKTIAATWTLLILVIIGNVGCAQPRQTELTGQNDLAIKYEHVYELGEIKKYEVPLQDTPNVSRIPSLYLPLGDKSYLVQASSTVSGRTIITVRLPSDLVEPFENIRVLQHKTNELDPSGSDWFDCTMLPWGQDESGAVHYNEEMSEYFPNPRERKISCELYSAPLKPDEYFVIASKRGRPPNAPSTRLDVSHTTEKDSDIHRYQVSIKNIGDRAVAEVNFRSGFDIDTNLVSFTNSQGVCKRSSWGNSGGSLVCHIGGLAPGAFVKLELTGRPSGISGAVDPAPTNKDWMIFGFFKERPNDPNFPVNSFEFKPLNATSSDNK